MLLKVFTLNVIIFNNKNTKTATQFFKTIF